MGPWKNFLIRLGLAKKKVRRRRLSSLRASRPAAPSRPRPRVHLIPRVPFQSSTRRALPSPDRHRVVPTLSPHFTTSQRSILVVGLANGGKTTLVNRMKPTKDREEAAAPTVGFSVERFSLHKCKLTVIDMSGQERYLDLWECYYKECQAVVFVVDATGGDDVLRESEKMLRGMLRRDELARRPLLVFANKSDVPTALGASDIARAVDLMGAAGDGRAWHIGACSALTGVGIDEGFRWLIGKL